MPRFPLWLAAAFLWLPAPAAIAAPEPKPSHTASLVMIGPTSDAIWVGNGPSTQAVALDPDAVPPGTLSFRNKGALAPIHFTLNRPSPALPAKEGVLRVFASQNQPAEGDPPLFGSFKLPPAPGHYDIFIDRHRSKKDWTDANHLILPASANEFPPGSLRLINLSDETIAAKVAGVTATIAARKTKIFRIPESSSSKLVPMQALRQSHPNAGPILRTAIRMQAPQRANLIIYPGRNTRKPIRALWYYQAAPEPLVRDRTLLINSAAPNP